MKKPVNKQIAQKHQSGQGIVKHHVGIYTGISNYTNFTNIFQKHLALGKKNQSKF